MKRILALLALLLFAGPALADGFAPAAGVPRSGGTFTGSVTVPNTGLRLLDTGGDHYTTVKQNSNEGANRTLNIPALGADDTVMTLATDQTITGLKTIATALGATDQFIVRNATEGYFFNTSSGLAEIVGYDGSAANDIGFRPGSMGAGAGLTVTGTAVSTNSLQLTVGDTASGSAVNLKAATTELTGLLGATATATGLIPAGVKLIGVVVRVTTLMEGATNFAIGDGTDVDRWGNAIAVAAGTVTTQTAFTADPEGTWSASARDVVLTPNIAFTAGAIRITAYYFDFTAPTS